ncbi:MAG: hypothetical protein CL609_13520 [Anaerolineaceae bacterium]|nr:hypothetical protein [Anaerolineaceae bacterium]
MRLFEFLLIVILLLSILLRFLRLQKTPWLYLFPLFSLLVITYHLFLEGYRWQMLPLYALALGLSLASIRQVKQESFKLRTFWTVVWLVVLIIFVLPPVLLPVPVYPKPTGPYDVGTTSFYWIDENREEVYAEQAGIPRRVMVQVWYPAALSGVEKRAPYLPDGNLDAQALAESFGFPKFFLNHLSLSKTQAYQGPALAECFETWPVLVFSHGWNGMRYQNTAQMVELASQGYIVFAPEHAYGAVISVYPDGNIIYNNPDALPSGVSDEEYAKAARILGKSWVGDLRFTLDQLQLLNAGEISSMFAGHLDLEKTGLFGHSTGGGGVFETCWLDDRCQAVLGEDPWLVPYDREIPQTGLSQPTVMMFSESWGSDTNKELVNQLWQNQPLGAVRMSIDGTSHYDFSDLPLYSPIAHLLGLKGPIKPEREINLINDYLVTFFDQHLKNADSSLMELSADYPEVQILQK